MNTKVDKFLTDSSWFTKKKNPIALSVQDYETQFLF